jgi:hypothetical protein
MSTAMYQQQQHSASSVPSSSTHHPFLFSTTAPLADKPYHQYHKHFRAQSINTTDISYPESYERTPIFALPFPHPKWHVKAGSKEVYEEVMSPIWDEYDAEVGYVDSVGEVRESVEGNEDKSVRQVVGRGKRRLDDVCEMDGENVKRKRCRDE